MSSENVPCLNPNLCGVKTHRPGTEARCRKGKLGANGAPTYLAAPPALSTTKSAPTVQLNTVEEADYAKVSSGESMDFNIPGDEDKARIVLVVNSNRDKGDIYSSTDNPLNGKIVTADGIEVWAGDYGATGSYEYSEGDTASSWVHPVDKDGEVIAHKITYSDFRQLEKANDMAYDIGWADEVNPEGNLSQEDMGREVVRRLHAEVEIKAKTQQIKREKSEPKPLTYDEAIESNNNLEDALKALEARTQKMRNDRLNG